MKVGIIPKHLPFRLLMSKSAYIAKERSFFQRVYELVSQIPAGRVVTYGQIATALGYAKGARQAGWAMRVCPDDIPWHRVVSARGTLSTRPLPGGFHLQRALLEDEGIHFDDSGRTDLRIYRWSEL